MNFFALSSILCANLLLLISGKDSSPSKSTITALLLSDPKPLPSKVISLATIILQSLDDSFFLAFIKRFSDSAAKPTLAIFDESFSSLDKDSKEKFKKIYGTHLQKDNTKSTIWVTHNKYELDFINKRYLKIENKKILEDYDP